MNSAFTAISFHSPSFNLQPPPQQRRHSRQHQISAKWTTRQHFSLQPIQAILGPNATGGLNNTNRGGNTLPSSALSDVIQEFYSSLNDKDPARLEKLISPDCIIQDNAYYKPLDVENTRTYFRRLMEAMGKNVKFAIDQVSQGVEPTVAVMWKDPARLEKLIAPDSIIQDTAYYKPLDVKNTRTYFRRLMEAMGKNVNFAIDEVSQGVEPTVALMWHLEWNGKIIPFAKGCSFYICSANGTTLRIRKVHIFEESPLKPGKLSLEILNFVTNLFDTFPNIAEGFLNNPEALLQSLVRFYKFYLEPFIVPLLAYYTHFWTYVSLGLTMLLNILYGILKRFV